MPRVTQNSWVLAQLKQGYVLSSRNAVLEYGIQDLPKRISELRRAGHKIESVRANGTSRHGEPTHWNVYSMVEEE